MAEGQVQRIVDILKAARSQKDVAAFLVPRVYALTLVDELFPVPVVKEAYGVASLDAMYRHDQIKVERERERYLKTVSDGGLIGTMFNVPMLVAEDCVICALDEGELRGYVELREIDLRDLVRI